MDASLARQLTQLANLNDPIALAIMNACAKKQFKCSLNFRTISDNVLNGWRNRGFYCEVNKNHLDCDCDWGCEGGCPTVTRVTFHWQEGYSGTATPGYVLAR